jgi:glycosyltransferase involved in cell wall biosynthesis
MKIALVTYSLNIGGVEVFIFSLAKEFLSQGHIVEIIETAGSGEWSSYFRENDLKVKTFKISPFTIPVVHVKKIIKYLRSFNVIFLNDSPYAQAGTGLLGSSIKIFPVLHNNMESMIRNAMSGYEQCNKVICVSPGLKQSVDSRAEKEISVFIPNGINPFGFAERDYSGKIRILFIGRIDDSQKGVYLLPEIALILKNADIDFIIEVAGDGPSWNELAKKINELGVYDLVVLKKVLPRSTIETAMRESHFLIMPSNYEGFGLVILEAMSCGLIPVVSYLPGYTDIAVQQNITGFFGFPGNAGSFAESIISALSDRSALNRISRNASILVNKYYSASIMAASYLKLINETVTFVKRSNRIDLSALPPYPYLPLLPGRITGRIFRSLALRRRA